MKELGTSNFSKLNINGPYEVGVRYFTTKTKGTRVMVFYPVDKSDQYEMRLNDKDTSNQKWLNDVPEAGQEAEGLKRMLQAKFKLPFFPQGFVTPWTNVRMDTLLDGELANGVRVIQPIIFSHGLTSSNYQYSGIARDLAAHGYLVILPQHQDGSCAYTMSQDREAMFVDYPDNQEKFYNKELRQR